MSYQTLQTTEHWSVSEPVVLFIFSSYILYLCGRFSLLDIGGLSSMVVSKCLWGKTLPVSKRKEQVSAEDWDNIAVFSAV